MTSAEKAKQLQPRGRDLAKKADYLTAIHHLKDRFDLVMEMKQRMIDLGILLSAGITNPEYRPEDGAAKMDPK
eukprot:3535681-Heterocapsa_arctica.AAC.1